MFVLSQVLDCEPLTINDRNEIHFPNEIVVAIGDGWIWDMFFDGQSFEDVSVWKEISADHQEFLIMRLSDEDMTLLGWKPGHEVTWETIAVDDDVTGDGPSTVVKVYSS